MLFETVLLVVLFGLVTIRTGTNGVLVSFEVRCWDGASGRLEDWVSSLSISVSVFLVIAWAFRSPHFLDYLGGDMCF